MRASTLDSRMPICLSLARHSVSVHYRKIFGLQGYLVAARLLLTRQLSKRPDYRYLSAARVAGGVVSGYCDGVGSRLCVLVVSCFADVA